MWPIIIIAFILLSDGITQSPTLMVILPTSYDGALPPESQMTLNEQLTIQMIETALPGSKVNPLPILRAISRYKKTPTTCLIGTGKPMVEREVVSAPIFKSEFKTYRLQDATGPIRSIAMLEGAESFATKGNNNFKASVATSNEALIEKLKRGRVDAIILGPRAISNNLVGKHNLVQVPGPTAVLIIRMRCHDTPEGRAAVASLDDFLASHIATHREEPNTFLDGR